MLLWPWAETFVLGLLPVLVWTIAPVQLFPPPGWVDPGLYLGYFLNLPLLLHRFAPEYHGMRLPWVLSGLVAHRIFSPVLAHLVLVFGFHWVAATSLYLTVMPRHGRLAGLLSTLFLTFNPLWIAAVTRGYVDGPGLAFQFATVAVVMNIDRFRTVWVPGLLTGILASLALYCHPVVGLFTGVSYLGCLVALRVQWRRAIDVSLWVAGGFAVATVALGLVSRVFGGPFLFPLVSLDFGRRALNGFGMAYRWPVRQWLPSAYMLLPPLALAFCGLGALAFQRATTGQNTVLKVGCAVLSASIMAFVIWDYGVGGSYLEASFSLTFLMAGQALVFAGLLAMALERVERQSRRLVAALSAGLLAVGLWPLATVHWLWTAEHAARRGSVVWIVLFVIVLGAAASLRTRGALAAPVLLLMVTSVAGVVNGDTRRMFRVDGNPDYRSFYRASHRVNAFIRSNLADDRSLFLWYNREAFSTGDADVDRWMRYKMLFQGQPLVLSAYDSFSSLWLWFQSTLNFGMPELAPDDLARLDGRAPVTLIMLCREVSGCQDGWKSMERSGYSIRLRAQTRIVEPAYIDLNMIAVDAARTAPAR